VARQEHGRKREYKTTTTITEEFLLGEDACLDRRNYWLLTSEPDVCKVLMKCLRDNHFDYANWLIVRYMDRQQRLRYALYAAQQVAYIYNEQYPGDERINDALNAVRAVIRDDTEETRRAARVASYATGKASEASYAAGADRAVAYAAFRAAPDRQEMRTRLINRGMRIMQDDTRRMNR